MHRTRLVDLEVVLAVARHKSFRAAARELGMSATAVSNAVAGLEARLAARLFHRSTRSVALTDAGQKYVDRVAPALAEIRSATEEVHSRDDEPTGTLRLNVPPEVAVLLFKPLLQEFAQRYPKVTLDVVTEPRLVDIVAEGFDAGIRLAEDVPLDMIAIPLTGQVPQFIVASPNYLEFHGIPLAPENLPKHQGILMRMTNGSVYRWELEKDGRRLHAEIPPRMVFSELRAIHLAARAGFGLAFLPEWFVAEDIKIGALTTVLRDWCKPLTGISLYYSGRRHVPPGLRALIDLAREKGTPFSSLECSPA